MRSDICEFQPAENLTDPIHISLHAHSLDDTLRFKALSYTWGAATRQHIVLIDDQPLPGTDSLYAALKRLHSSGQLGPLWIDAISI
jgi:hypothetical protein